MFTRNYENPLECDYNQSGHKADNNKLLLSYVTLFTITEAGYFPNNISFIK